MNLDLTALESIAKMSWRSRLLCRAPLGHLVRMGWRGLRTRGVAPGYRIAHRWCALADLFAVFVAVVVN